MLRSVSATGSPSPVPSSSSPSPARDRLGRPFRDLRVSATDRCNFRCRYCMPKEVYGAAWRFLPHAEILTYEEIERVARAAVARGASKIRVTGGEPLLRRDLASLVAGLAAIDGVLDLALTTNGSVLARHAPALAAAGLQRVTVSLDALSEPVFHAMNDVAFPVVRVLDGIDAAAAAGLAPVKVNAVVKRGFNEDEIVPMVRHFRERGHVVRFIEYMDVGTTNGWRLDDVVPAAEILARLERAFHLEPVEPAYLGEVAHRWRFADEPAGEVGIVTSVTGPFCRGCTRLRLSAEGKLYTCLFASNAYDVKALLRSGASDRALREMLGSQWASREDRYSEERATRTDPGDRVEMSTIGG
ncbi:MAG: GTP 3',8-cyclase MoaA [Planctomycetota bacterium]